MTGNTDNQVNIVPYLTNINAPELIPNMLFVQGHHILGMKFEKGTLKIPVRMEVEARVQDIDHHSVEAFSSLLVHPAEVYVGLRYVSAINMNRIYSL